jgi:hypothetical protein
MDRAMLLFFLAFGVLWLLLFLIFMACLLGAVFRRLRSLGRVLRVLPRGFRVFRNVALTSRSAPTVVPFVVAGPRGIWVIEEAAVPPQAVVSGEAQAREWLVAHAGAVRGLRNPLRRAWGHARALEEALGLEEGAVQAMVVFPESARLFVWGKKDVVLARGAAGALKLLLERQGKVPGSLPEISRRLGSGVLAPAALVLVLALGGCREAAPHARVEAWSPTATPTRTPTATATPGWWATVAVEMQTPLATLAVPTLQALPTHPALTPGALPTGFPSLLPTVTPVAYEDLVGKILFRTDREGFERIYVMEPDGSGQRPLYTRQEDFLGKLAGELYSRALARQVLSPDGGHQVFVQNAWGRAQIFVRRLSDGASWQLTRLGAGVAYDPAWQPTGDLIAFVSNESGNDEIWVIHSDGSGARQLTRNTWEWDKYPSWSPDGTRIVFWSNRDGRKQIYVMNADGSGQQNISRNPHNDYDPVWVR